MVHPVFGRILDHVADVQEERARRSLAMQMSFPFSGDNKPKEIFMTPAKAASVNYAQFLLVMMQHFKQAAGDWSFDAQPDATGHRTVTIRAKGNHQCILVKMQQQKDASVWVILEANSAVIAALARSVRFANSISPARPSTPSWDAPSDTPYPS